MSTVETSVVPTQDQIFTAIADVSSRIAAMTVCESFVIEDYPIGGRNRGQCKLGVEYKKGSGYRTVRETTNKHGAWCAPKKSVYNIYGIGVVVSGEGVERDAQWLHIGTNGIYLRSANYETTVLLRQMIDPYTRTEEAHWEINGVTKVLPKASQAEIDAVQAWKAGINELMHTVLERFKAARLENKEASNLES